MVQVKITGYSFSLKPMITKVEKVNFSYIEVPSFKCLCFLLMEMFLLLWLFPLSGVARVVLNISLPLCPVQYRLVLFNSTLSIPLHLVFCSPLHVFAGTGGSTILLTTCPSSLLSACPYHVSLSSVIVFVTGATFTDPLASNIWSYLSS